MRCFRCGSELSNPTCACGLIIVEHMTAICGSIQQQDLSAITEFIRDTGISGCSSDDELLEVWQQGDCHAAFYLGQHFEDSGKPEDLKTAFDWYSKAADGGVPAAYLKLSHMWKKGRGRRILI